MKIQVTQEDINNSDHSIYSCPIFKAISRKLPRVFCVGYKYVSFIGVTGNIEVNLPKPIVEWIKEYDAVGDASPAEFDF